MKIWIVEYTAGYDLTPLLVADSHPCAYLALQAWVQEQEGTLEEWGTTDQTGGPQWKYTLPAKPGEHAGSTDLVHITEWEVQCPLPDTQDGPLVGKQHITCRHCPPGTNWTHGHPPLCTNPTHDHTNYTQP